MVSYPRSCVFIDDLAFKNNLTEIKKIIGLKKSLALVVKADAYGHGLEHISKLAVDSGVDWLMVATVSEGIALRKIGIELPILVLSPIIDDEISEALIYDLRLVADDLNFMVRLDHQAHLLKKKALVHIKIDTGLSRYGIMPCQIKDFISNVKNFQNITIEGIATHFIDSAKRDDLSKKQIQAFNSAIHVSKVEGIHYKYIHLSNTSSILKYSDDDYNLVRIGAAAYGIDYQNAYQGRISPVLTWKARILSIRKRPAGSGVSYESTYTTQKETTIATLGVGYGDGYPRSLGNTAYVYMKGYKAPVIGLICMDQALIDITDIPDVHVGDDVELLGKNVRPYELSVFAGLNPRELAIGITSRVPRVTLAPDHSVRILDNFHYQKSSIKNETLISSL